MINPQHGWGRLNYMGWMNRKIFILSSGLRMEVICLPDTFPWVKCQEPQRNQWTLHTLPLNVKNPLTKWAQTSDSKLKSKCHLLTGESHRYKRNEVTQLVNQEASLPVQFREQYAPFFGMWNIHEQFVRSLGSKWRCSSDKECGLLLWILWQPQPAPYILLAPWQHCYQHTSTGWMMQLYWPPSPCTMPPSKKRIASVNATSCAAFVIKSGTKVLVIWATAHFVISVHQKLIWAVKLRFLIFDILKRGTSSGVCGFVCLFVCLHQIMMVYCILGSGTDTF